MVRGHQSEKVLQSKISMTAPAGFVLGRKKRLSACSTWHVPSRPAPECFSAGSTWPPFKRPRKSSIRTPIAKAGELGEVDTDSDGVMRLERTAVLARYEEMERRQQTSPQKTGVGSEQPGMYALADALS